MKESFSLEAEKWEKWKRELIGQEFHELWRNTKDHDIVEVIRLEQTEHSEWMNYWAEEGEQRRAQTMQIKTQNKTRCAGTHL